MKKYLSYKDSEVGWIGEIPNTWKVSRLKKYFDERNEKVSDLDFSPLSVTKGGILPQLDNVSKSDNHNDRKRVCKNDFVINSRSDRKGSSGMSLLDGSVSLINIVLKPKSITPKYSHYIFKSKDFIEEFFRNGKGIHWDLWSTRFSELQNIKIPIPPISEQQQIVSFLDTKTSLIDSLIEKTQKKIELLKESIPNYHFYTNEKNRFIEMKEYWFQKKPSKWRVLKLREIFDIISERNHPNERLLSVHQIKGVVFRDEQSQDVMNPSGDISNYKLVKPGDFIISLRSSEGGFEYSEVTGLVSPVYTVLRPKFEIDTVFYKYLFKTHNFIVELNRFIKGIRDGKNINFIDIRDVLVPVPLEFNYKVHKTHLNILKSFSLEEKRIELLKEYRESLISEVVTGKLKVTTDE